MFPATEQGTDYSKIIDDLSNGENREIVKLNVGLLISGLLPDFSEEDRIRFRPYYCAYEKSNKIYYYKMEAINFSRLTGVVFFKETQVRASKIDTLEDGTFVYGEFEEQSDSCLRTLPIDDFLYEYECSQTEAEAACRKTERK